MIIHPSSGLLTAEALHRETMREQPAPGLHPKKKVHYIILSRCPDFESREAVCELDIKYK